MQTDWMNIYRDFLLLVGNLRKEQRKLYADRFEADFEKSFDRTLELAKSHLEICEKLEASR